ncbi:M23 family metallopeptidase [Saccharothrix violaceirubra]|uniref:M23ase beta-sheet core domain-containing protein n=1 Tax=Saccharothrix violaceirubra TaxID=413306 RepID=A0A7W7T547_9PSEU|nr:M23 family metallopeptidase [Saccharothrix violaceirubra]MBB4966758.1 hypothetical protein [Saccharothrix violaceirubra]
MVGVTMATVLVGGVGNATPVDEFADLDATAALVDDFEATEGLEDTELDEVTLAKAPKFQLPFKCGQVWLGTTYNGHWPSKESARDFWRDGGKTKGQPILAAAGGKVISAKYGSRQGWGVSLNNGDGYRTYYFHMTSKPKVKNGQKVKQGDLLGYVGDTGQAKGNPHMHYSVTKVTGGKEKGIKPYFDGKFHKPGTKAKSKNKCR